MQIVDIFAETRNIAVDACHRADIAKSLRAIDLCRRVTDFVGRPDVDDLERYLAHYHPAAGVSPSDRAEAIGGKPRTAEEVRGSSMARARVSEWAQARYIPNVADIIDLNRMLRGIDDARRRVISPVAREITCLSDGAIRYRGAHPSQFDRLLEGFVKELGASANLARRDPSLGLLLAASTQLQLVLIHPFDDGNGRTARALTRYLQIVAGIDLQVSALDEHYLWDRRAFEQSLMIKPNFDAPLDRFKVSAWLARMAHETRRASEIYLKACVAVRARRALRGLKWKKLNRR